MRGLVVLMALSISTGPYLFLSLTGGRASLIALVGGDPQVTEHALLFTGAWVWFVFSTVPLSIGALVWCLMPPGSRAG